MSGTNAKKRDWGLFFAGLAVFIAGLVILLWPGLSLVVIAEIAGVFLIVAGIFDFIAYARLRGTTLTNGWVIVSGVCDIILGLMFLIHPIVSASVIPLLAGAFVTAYGIMAIVTAIGLRSSSLPWGIMVANGIISILCGIMFAFMPASFAIFLGIFMMMRGVTMSVYGLTTPPAQTLFM